MSIPSTETATPNFNTGDFTVISVENDVHEGVEHEADGEVGVGVLAVGQVGQEEHGGVVVHVQRRDLPEVNECSFLVISRY